MTTMTTTTMANHPFQYTAYAHSRAHVIWVRGVRVTLPCSPFPWCVCVCVCVVMMVYRRHSHTNRPTPALSFMCFDYLSYLFSEHVCLFWGNLYWTHDRAVLTHITRIGAGAQREGLCVCVCSWLADTPVARVAGIACRKLLFDKQRIANRGCKTGSKREITRARFHTHTNTERTDIIHVWPNKYNTQIIVSTYDTRRMYTHALMYILHIHVQAYARA